MASSFPNQIDDIKQFLDVTQTDAILLNTFQSAMVNGDFATANLTLKQIINYDQKIVSAERLNQLRDAILALENFYKAEIYPYLKTKQEDWQRIINLFSYVGDYNVSTQYYKNNIVSYTYNGLYQLYIALQDTKGNNPTNEEYWRVFTIKGMRGENGIDSTSFAFEWDNSYDYNVNTIVSYKDAWYISIQSNINQQPNDSNVYWQKILVFPQANYPIQSEKPNNQQIGELWFEVI